MTCDGCGDELEFGVVHDCPVLGVEVTVTPAEILDVRLTGDEQEFCEGLAEAKGLPFLLDHLGLDGLANEVVTARAERDAALADSKTMRGAYQDAYDEAKRFEAQVATLTEALREIAKGEGRYSRDPLTHAANTIEDIQAIARAALSLTGPTAFEQDVARDMQDPEYAAAYREQAALDLHVANGGAAEDDPPVGEPEGEGSAEPVVGFAMRAGWAGMTLGDLPAGEGSATPDSNEPICMAPGCSHEWSWHEHRTEPHTFKCAAKGCRCEEFEGPGPDPKADREGSATCPECRSDDRKIYKWAPPDADPLWQLSCSNPWHTTEPQEGT